MSATAETNDGTMDLPAPRAERQADGGVVLVLLAWLAAGGFAVYQYGAARTRISDAFDISAIQVQQVNSEAMLQIVVAFVCAVGLTAVVAVRSLAMLRRSP